MSKVKLVRLLEELESYVEGNEEMFDGWLNGTVWGKIHGKSQRTLSNIVQDLNEDEANNQLVAILDELIEYDEEQTGMFDYILEENGRNPICK